MEKQEWQYESYYSGRSRSYTTNAYTVHHLTHTHEPLLNILEVCRQAGNPDWVFASSSTSKISFPGAGIAILTSSENNINWLKKQINIQTIGPDKLNQLCHVRFFKDRTGIEKQMRQHAALIRPKFVLPLLSAFIRVETSDGTSYALYRTSQRRTGIDKERSLKI